MENLLFYTHETGVLFVEGFAEKFFFLSSTKLSEVVQDIAFDALAPDCSIQVLSIFSEVLSAVFMCMQLPGNRVSSHCLSKVCVPAKLHKLTAVVCNVLPFEAFFWHLLFGGSFPSFANLQPSA